MSKKETEFDRFDRMKKLEREAEVEKRKSTEVIQLDIKKKGGKSKSISDPVRKDWTRGYETILDEEYEYV